MKKTNLIFLIVLLTFLFQLRAEAFFNEPDPCQTYLNHGLPYDPIGINANGVNWFGYVHLDPKGYYGYNSGSYYAIQASKTAHLYDSSGAYLGAYVASFHAFTGDCVYKNTEQYHIKVPGDDGSTYIELNQTSAQGAWFTRVLWAGKIYKRSSTSNVLN